MALRLLYPLILVMLMACNNECLLLNDPSAMEQRLSQMEALVQGLTQEVKGLTQDVSSLKQENSYLKSKISTGQTPAFFSAYRKNHLSFTTTTQTDVVYDGVRSNFHTCYNTSSGQFIAPFKGFYVFSWETLTTAGKIFDSELLVNGVRYMLNACNNIAQNTAYSSCTGVAPVQLEVGDIVHIRALSATFLHGDWSSFSGWLVTKT
ncbi:cerebellin-1-like [Saccostrea echinata]|uniref:cerebellin-1-like n=1 Tax=Saccostrea echinata TaxID=191078 RepID=UPI002A80265E|nr:cerebellin-1-like [Saccostrea echinata]